VDLAQGLRRHEVPVDEHPIEPRSPAVAHEPGGRRRGQCHHHHGSDVPLVALQFQHLRTPNMPVGILPAMQGGVELGRGIDRLAVADWLFRSSKRHWGEQGRRQGNRH
jgi:hypothetical protein